MISRPVILTTTNETTKPAKRILFRAALMVGIIGSVLVGTILLVKGGLALGHLQYFTDVGDHPLHITSALLIFFGLLALTTFVLLTVGLIKVNRLFTLIATGLLAACSLALIAFSIWSSLTVTSGQLPNSINNALTKEMDQTRYSPGPGNSVIIENTNKMSRLEKQHRCCGINEPLEDYRSRQSSIFGSSSSSSSSSGNSPSSNVKGSRTTTQRGSSQVASSVGLPLSCCNEKFRTAENCIDPNGNSNDATGRYNMDGCYEVIVRDKFQRIQEQSSTTVITACLAVISTIALAAVLRLMSEGYQVAPLVRVA